MYRGYRATSVPPGLYRQMSHVSAKTTPGRLPSYCPAHGQYYGYSSYSTPVTTSTRQVTSSTIPGAASSTARVSYRSPMTLNSTRYFDPVYPSRQFGTRLSKGYGSTLSRPELYEQAYGVSFLPGYGRDSYSAYRVADATFDDSDDLISASCKRDNQVLRNVERTMASVSNLPPVKRPSVRMRSSSVPPQLTHTPLVTSSKVTRYSTNRNPKSKAVVKVRNVADDMFYKVPPPKVQYKHETVNKGSDLLKAKERMYARELIDLTSPTATLGLRMRIQNAQDSIQKQGMLLGRYYVGPDKDDIEVDAELKQIKANRALRAKSVV